MQPPTKGVENDETLDYKANADNLTLAGKLVNYNQGKLQSR